MGPQEGLVDLTEPELIDALCATRPDWAARRERIHRSAIYYVDGARLGVELAEAVIEGRHEPWMVAAFEVLERGFVEGTSSTVNLIVVGLFEAMQGPAYARADPPDCLETWFGPRSRQAWADLIEGWIGTGIRSIEAWRRVVLNGSRTLVALASPRLAFRVELATRSATEVEQILAPIRPLLAVRVVPEVSIEKAYATLVVLGPRGATSVEFGDATRGGRFARCEERCFVINFDKLVEAWSWLVTSA